MLMTPRLGQFETRCTHNKVHSVLNEQERCNPPGLNAHTLGQRTSVHSKFIPKAKSLPEKEVQGTFAKLGYRMPVVRAFERYVRRDYLAARHKAQRDRLDAEIQP